MSKLKKQLEISKDNLIDVISDEIVSIISTAAKHFTKSLKSNADEEVKKDKKKKSKKAAS